MGIQRSFDVSPPVGVHFTEISVSGGSAISPDGRLLAFAGTTAKGETHLYLRPLDSLDARALPGTEDGGRPFWSPDSKSIGFFADAKLKRIDVAGGSAVALCDTTFARGGAWNEDGEILFSNGETGLQRITASGGQPEIVARIDRGAGELFHQYPQFLPGGKQFLYLARHQDVEKSTIRVGWLDGRPPVDLLPAAYNASYDPASSRLLYIQGTGTLMARQLDLQSPRITGEPVALAEGVSATSTNAYANFSISRNGILYYGRGEASPRVRFRWRDRSGTVLQETSDETDAVQDFRLSPGGDKIVYRAANGSPDIWVMNLANGQSSRLTFGGGNFPRWSPDGKFVYYKTREGIFRKAADGSGGEISVLKIASVFTLQSISGDGKYMLFGLNDILVLPLEGERSPKTYLQSKSYENQAAFSPDGRWVAYSSNESGRSEIYVEGFPERQGRRQISAGGGGYARWRADGRELYWRGSDGKLTAASIEMRAESVSIGPPESLFPVSLFGFEPSRDGRRFLTLDASDQHRGERSMAVVLNWSAKVGR